MQNRIIHFLLVFMLIFSTIYSVAQNRLSATIEIKQLNEKSLGEITVHATGGKPPYTYHWRHNNDTNATIKNLLVGTYLVTVTDANATTVTAFGSTIKLPEEDLFANNSFKIYKVPSSELIVVQAHEMLLNSLQVELLNEKGERLITKDFYQGSTICHIETTTLYNGEYSLVLTSNGEKKVFKISIQRE